MAGIDAILHVYNLFHVRDFFWVLRVWKFCALFCHIKCHTSCGAVNVFPECSVSNINWQVLVKDFTLHFNFILKCLLLMHIMCLEELNDLLFRSNFMFVCIHIYIYLYLIIYYALYSKVLWARKTMLFY